MDLKDIIRIAAGGRYPHRYALRGPHDGWKGASKLLRRLLIGVIAFVAVGIVLVAVGIAVLVANFDTVRGWFTAAGQSTVQQVQEWSTQVPEQKQRLLKQKQRAMDYLESVAPLPAGPAQTPAPAEQPAAGPVEEDV